jgi:type II secretory pathway component PulF
VAVFNYHALDSDRAAVSGSIAADTPRQARDLLRAKGLRVGQVTENRGSRKVTGWPRLGSSRATVQWAVSVHELAMLLRAGIPMLEALDTISQQQRGRFKTTLLAVRDQVAAGSSLAEAMRQRPDVFDTLSIHLVDVGENAGTLEQVLDQLAAFQRRSLELKDRVLTALIYPMFLVVFGIAATTFLMTWVMPPLLESLQEQLVSLPWPTRVVKWCSDLLVGHGWLIAFLAIAVAGSVAGALRTTRGRLLWHKMLLKLPLIGQLILKQNMSRIAMVIATLSRSGIVLTRTLQLAAGSTKNVLLRSALHDASLQVGAGRDMVAALEDANIFPPLAVRIFAVGQETGRLEEMLDQLADDYDRQVATASARLSALLEPILIVVLAVFVGFALVATILPILEAGNVL